MVVKTIFTVGVKHKLKPLSHSYSTPLLNPDRCRFLIFSVKARPGRQGRIVDKEDFIHKILNSWIVLLLIIHSFVRFSSLVTLSTLSTKSYPQNNVKNLHLSGGLRGGNKYLIHHQGLLKHPLIVAKFIN